MNKKVEEDKSVPFVLLATNLCKGRGALGSALLVKSPSPVYFQNAVIAALSSKCWDVETATELLLSN